MRIKKTQKFLGIVLDIVKLVVIAFVIVWPIHHFIFQPFYVIGPSMEPNFYNKEYLIIEKVSYYTNAPKRGEVIVFQSASGPKNYLIKRVVGLPGERIVIKKGKVYVYNKSFKQGILLQEEKYLSAGTSTPGNIDIKLLDNEYYVLGDNRNMSLDSRTFGSIKQDNIIGKAWFRGWPIEDVGLIKLPVFAY